MRGPSTSAVACKAAPGTAARFTSRLTPLTDVARYDELLERGRLGDLVTRRLVDQHLDPDFERRRSDDMRHWLSEMAS